MADEKLSPVEGIKQASNYLRGDIAAELTSGADSFAKPTTQLIKFHGTYQQDDRETRTAREGGGKSVKSYSFMVRSRIPGGRLTSGQLLAELELCDEIGNTTLRITSRQGLQLHGVLMRDLKQAIRRINEIQLSTLAACGDVMRNVMCCPAPHGGSPVHAQLQRLTDELVAHLAPRTRAYHELWLTDDATGEQTLAGGGEVEPIYGPTYLPRKFKVAVGLTTDNCVDLYSQDLGLLAIVEHEQIVGYNVLVGGGFGVTPAIKKTFPAVARRMAFIRPDQAIDVAAAVIKVQRDFGNRGDRKLARLKYLIADWGLPKFKAKVEEYYGQSLPDPHSDDVRGFDDHIGWREQGDGRLYYGLNVENGRLKDEGDFRIKTALREICRRYEPGIRLTAHQSILLTDVASESRGAIESILREHGVSLSEDISTVRRWSMACVAWPTCGLAITESERALPGIIDQIEVEAARLGLADEVFTVRMTGCPNGCARPYNSDVGLVGKAKDRYTIYLGGRVIGDRLNFIYKDLVPGDEIAATLAPVLAYFKDERQLGESFGDFCHRKGAEDLLAWSEKFVAQATA